MKKENIYQSPQAGYLLLEMTSMIASSAGTENYIYGDDFEFE